MKQIIGKIVQNNFKTPTHIINHIKRSIANRDDGVFLCGEFNRFGSPAQLGRVLTQLMSESTLVRLGTGGYAKAKPSILTGKPVQYVHA